mmetsp:Transcript_20750/g.42890  ORF Transcript_20750/g.42890 Transcript_20750/m.42890 type:complete len:317 (-) Transcript_20750:7-957(-)
MLDFLSGFLAACSSWGSLPSSVFDLDFLSALDESFASVVHDLDFLSGLHVSFPPSCSLSLSVVKLDHFFIFAILSLASSFPPPTSMLDLLFSFLTSAPLFIRSSKLLMLDCLLSFVTFLLPLDGRSKSIDFLLLVLLGAASESSLFESDCPSPMALFRFLSPSIEFSDSTRLIDESKTTSSALYEERLVYALGAQYPISRDLRRLIFLGLKSPFASSKRSTSSFRLDVSRESARFRVRHPEDMTPSEFLNEERFFSFPDALPSSPSSPSLVSLSENSIKSSSSMSVFDDDFLAAFGADLLELLASKQSAFVSASDL